MYIIFRLQQIWVQLKFYLKGLQEGFVDWRIIQERREVNHTYKSKCLERMKIRMRKLKIGITCYPTVGGSGVIATELGKMLAERGHEIHFITSSVPFRLNKIYPNVFFHEVEVNNYSVFQYPPYDIALASKMADVIKDEKLDIFTCPLCDSTCSLCSTCT